MPVAAGIKHLLLVITAMGNTSHDMGAETGGMAAAYGIQDFMIRIGKLIPASELRAKGIDNVF